MVPAAMPGAQMYYHGGYPPAYPQYVPQPQPVLQPGEDGSYTNVIYYLTVQLIFLASGRGVERRGGRREGRKREKQGKEGGKEGMGKKREGGREGGRKEERERGRKEEKNRDKEVRAEGSRQKNRQCSALEEIYGLWKATSPNGWISVLSLQCPCSQHSSHSNHCVLESGMKT